MKIWTKIALWWTRSDINDILSGFKRTLERLEDHIEHQDLKADLHAAEIAFHTDAHNAAVDAADAASAIHTKISALIS